MEVQLLGRGPVHVGESGFSFDDNTETIRSVTISLAEYRDLLREVGAIRRGAR